MTVPAVALPLELAVSKMLVAISTRDNVKTERVDFFKSLVFVGVKRRKQQKGGVWFIALVIVSWKTVVQEALRLF